MAHKISFKKSVAKDLKKIDPHEIEKIFNKIESDPIIKADSLPELQGKFAGLRKFRVGNYRIIFTIIEETILILRIQHRKDLYQK